MEEELGGEGAFVVRGGRLCSVDVLRGVALVFMVVNHFGDCLVGGGWQSPTGIFVRGVGIFPAALFYMVAGISVVLVDHRLRRRGEGRLAVWRRLLPRAFLIVVMGYLFNVVVFGWGELLSWSVLQLIGLSLIVCQLSLELPWQGRVALAAIFVAAAPPLRLLLGYEAVWGVGEALHYQPPQSMAEHLAAIVATGKMPIFPWMACPLVGALIGEAVVAKPPRPRLLAKASAGSGASLLLLIPPLMVWTGDTVTQFPLTTGFILLAMGTALLLVAAAVATVDLWGWWNPAYRFFEVNGQIALIIYIAHHLYGYNLLCLALGLHHQLEAFGLALALVSYFAPTLLFAKLWLPIRRRHTSLIDLASAYALLGVGLALRLALPLFGLGFPP